MKLILENWRNYLDEVESMGVIPGTDTYEGKQNSIDYFWGWGKENLEDASKFMKTNKQEIGAWKGNPVITFTDPTGRDTFYFVLENEWPVFYIATEPHKEGIITGNVRKSGGNFRATDFYKWLVEQYGVVYSDTFQSPGGQKIWARLGEDPEINVEEDGDRLKATKIS
jgi:hypothetical protein